MAIVRPLNSETFQDWKATRPQVIQEMLDHWPPDRLYRMTSTSQRCTIYSYCEDGTVTVSVTGEYNLVTFARNVFGIDPQNLTECDLPAPEEVTGALLTTEEQIECHLKAFRARRDSSNKGT